MAKKKLTKTQEWLIVGGICVVLALAVGASYYYLTMDSNDGELSTTQETSQSQATEEVGDLNEIESELDEIEEMDLSELDAIEEDLDSIDTSEL